MDNFFIFFIIGAPILICTIIIVVRTLIDNSNKKRIDRFFADRNEELLETLWKPFGPGWAGSQGVMIYAVKYRDQANNIHQVWIKTGPLSGVYFTEDRIFPSEKGQREA